MSNDLENKLRGALRPVDPGEDFTRRVMSRIERGGHGTRRPTPTRFYWMTGALAASVVACVFVFHTLQTQREREGLEARAQLMQALRLTGEKLDVAYQFVNGEPQ